MATTKRPIIGMSAPVSIDAADKEGEEPKGPPKFTAEFYTGGALEIDGWDLPVVVDLAGLQHGKVLVANLDHDRTKRVGNFAVANDGKSLVANGTASAATAARDEVVNSARDGYQWQASLEVNPSKVEQVKAGKTVEVNGQTFEGPLYVTRAGTLKGFGFVSHGADDNTTASIAASAASTKGKTMKAEVKAWADKMGLEIDSLSDEVIANIEADFEGKPGKRKITAEAGSTPAEKRKIEATRRKEINAIADQWMEKREGDLEWINAIDEMRDHAIEAKQSIQEFKNDLYESMIPAAQAPVVRAREQGLTGRIIEAALAQAGRLKDIEKKFTDQELQAAHDRFKGAIGLNQFLILAAEARGYRGMSASKVTPEVLAAAMPPRFGPIHAQGWSTIDVAAIVANTANKFIREGWMAVDQTALRIANIRSVNDFKQTTTVSLTGALQFEEVGAGGEIKHGTLDTVSYNNQAKTYGQMLAITRQDIINDDLNALSAVPRRLGRGGMLKLNDIFWTEFLILETDGFFAAGNNNLLDGVADMTLAGLARAEALFLNQTDYDGKPLGIEPAIVLVPTALKATAAALLDPQSRMVTGASSTIPDTNVFRGRFRLESSPYMSNSSYTGFSAAEWYLMADPSVLPTIEIAALNGRVEPTVDTADADFNTLGIQMRGYADVGVTRQEKKAAVLADGGSS